MQVFGDHANVEIMKFYLVVIQMRPTFALLFN